MGFVHNKKDIEYLQPYIWETFFMQGKLQTKNNKSKWRKLETPTVTVAYHAKQKKNLRTAQKKGRLLHMITYRNKTV